MENALMGILPWLLALGVIWFLMIRPQQQAAKKHNTMLRELKPGTKVITIGGICGKIKALTDDRVFLEIAEGLTIEMLRASIRQVDTEPDEVEDDDDDEDDDSDVYYDEDDSINDEK